MSIGELIALVGVVVALLAIAMPQIVNTVSDRRRFRARIRYRLESFAHLGQLAAIAAIDVDKKEVRSDSDVAADHDAHLRNLRVDVDGFYAVLDEGARRFESQMRRKFRRRWIDRLLRRRPTGTSSMEDAVSDWHLLTGYLRLIMGRPGDGARQLGGVAQVSIGVANVMRSTVEARGIGAPAAHLIFA
jgi:hypothetical protein